MRLGAFGELILKYQYIDGEYSAMGAMGWWYVRTQLSRHEGMKKCKDRSRHPQARRLRPSS